VNVRGPADYQQPVSKNIYMNNKSIAWIFYALIAALLITWYAFEPYPSHYLSGLRVLGDTVTQNLWGVAKEGRGDEWSTYLPMLKQSALEGFPARSSLEPYREQLNWFIALPKADLSLLFLPNYVMYWILPAGKALSFQAFFYYALLIGSVCWYLQNLRVNRALALIVAVSLTFSQLYQVWWTSNFPALAACILPFAILTSKLKPTVRTLLLFWSVGHMVFGQMYPPTYFAVAVALVPLTLVVRPDLMNWKTLGLAAFAAASALVIYLIWNADFISAVAGTSYPGRRFSAGGGSTFAAMAAAVFPTMPVSSVPGGDATYELSMAGTLVPLMSVALLPFVKWDRPTVQVTVASGLLVLMLVIYGTVGFPPALAKWTGFFVMPGRRAHPGISLILVIWAAVIISRNWRQWKLAPIAIVLVGYACISAVLGFRPDAEKEFWGVAYYPYLPLACLAVAYVLVKTKVLNLEMGPAVGYSVLTGMAIAHVVVFGSFNPVMRGSDIMEPVHSQLITDWKALYEANNNRPFAVDGNFGHLLRGEGLPALEAIHLVNVDTSIYRSIFPELSDEELNLYFNRFVGIAFANVDRVDPRGATVAFALKPRSVVFNHRVVSEASQGPTLLLQPPKGTISRLSDKLYKAQWSGVLNAPFELSRVFTLALPCETSDSWITRSPIPGVDGAASDGTSLRLITGEMIVDAETEVAAAQCIETMKVE